MKIYKNAKEVVRTKHEYTSYYYEYTCPFCKSTFKSYSLKDESLIIRCSCGNKLKFKW